MANLKIPHYFLDIVSIEDEYVKESWKSFVRILSCQAAYSGFIPTNLHIHKKSLEINETMGTMTDVIWDVCCNCYKHINYGDHNTRKNRMQSLGFKILKFT